MHSEPIALTLETCIFLQPHCVNKFSNPADSADDADPPLENDRRSAALVALFFAWRRIFRPVLLILLAVVGLSALSCRIAAPTVGSVSQGCSVLPIFLGLLAAV